jgi:hypothetical protein
MAGVAVPLPARSGGRARLWLLFQQHNGAGVLVPSCRCAAYRGNASPASFFRKAALVRLRMQYPQACKRLLGPELQAFTWSVRCEGAILDFR